MMCVGDAMENKLNELNIFVLRDLARRTGVNSPTSKKKDELIKGIVEILSGEKQPQINKTKQGRPPKVFGYDFANVFNAQSLNNITLNQTMEPYSNDDITTVAGWVELVNNNSAILWVNRNLKNETFFIPSSVVGQQELRNGDRVVVELGVNDNQYYVKNIFSINGYPVKQQIERMHYDMIDHCPSNQKVEFNNVGNSELNIKFGENVYFYGNNNYLNTKAMIELINDCKIQNKIYINISVAEKNKSVLMDLNNTEMFIANITEDSAVVKRNVTLALERAKRILEIGESCLLIVDDLLSISAIDNGQLVRGLVAAAKEGNNNGSITLCAVMPNDSLVQIEKLADKRFNILDGQFVEKII